MCIRIFLKFKICIICIKYAKYAFFQKWLKITFLGISDDSEHFWNFSFFLTEKNVLEKFHTPPPKVKMELTVQWYLLIKVLTRGTHYDILEMQNMHNMHKICKICIFQKWLKITFLGISDDSEHFWNFSFLTEKMSPPPKVHKCLKNVWYYYSKTSKRFKAEGETGRLTQNDLKTISKFCDIIWLASRGTPAAYPTPTTYLDQFFIIYHSAGKRDRDFNPCRALGRRPRSYITYRTIVNLSVVKWF